MNGRSDTDRRLAELARTSPDVAAALDTERPPLQGRHLRLALVLVLLAAALGGLWYAASRMAPRRPASHPAQEIDRSQWLAPIRTEALPGGEQVAEFSGFAISVDTDPAGALVTIAGVPRGEAPVLAGLDCAPGAPVEVRAEKQGFPVAVTHTTCRRDALVKLVVRLGR